jgi:hypothetical protein
MRTNYQALVAACSVAVILGIAVSACPRANRSPSQGQPSLALGDLKSEVADALSPGMSTDEVHAALRLDNNIRAAASGSWMQWTCSTSRFPGKMYHLTFRENVRGTFVLQHWVVDEAD